MNHDSYPSTNSLGLLLKLLFIGGFVVGKIDLCSRELKFDSFRSTTLKTVPTYVFKSQQLNYLGKNQFNWGSDWESEHFKHQRYLYTVNCIKRQK